MKNFFTEHPKSIGESYFVHFLFAFKSGFSLFLAGLACMVHSIFPFIFISTASRTINAFNQKMADRQNKDNLTSSQGDNQLS